MKKINIILSLLALLYFSSNTMLFSAETEKKKAYAYLTMEVVDGQESKDRFGLVSFDLEDASKIELVHAIGKAVINPVSGARLDVGAGAFANGKYYYYESWQQIYGYDAVALNALDIATGTVTQVADYSTNKKITYSSMTYDYSTETMYALDGYQGSYTGLVKVDLATGAVTSACTFSTFKGEYDHKYYFRAIAASYDGSIYGLTYYGDFYEINKTTGLCTFIGNVGYVPSTALMYTQSLEFDKTDDILYWTLWDFYDGASVYTIDVATGKASFVSTIENKAAITGLYIPFKIAEPEAPDAVSELKLTRGENGERSALLEWINPSKTFGTESPLTSLTKIEIYRNKELVHTITNPTVGESVSWSETNIPDGVTTYKILPYNASGSGKPKSITQYIGHGVPIAVSNIALANDNGKAKLSWSAPESGKFDSWYDKASLVYDIKRFPNETIVASGISDTSFVDNTITDLAQYYYTIQPKTVDGEGDIATSPKAAIGPNQIIPYLCNFETEDIFNTWTIVDANGDNYSWLYSEGTWGRFRTKSATYTNPWSGVINDDWIISPAVELKKDQAYKLTFNVATSSSEYIETLEVTLGKGITAESQTELLGKFDIQTSDFAHIRINLPNLTQDDIRHIGLHLISDPNQSYMIRIDSVRLQENHDGAITGKITKSGLPVSNAKVEVLGTNLVVYSNENGEYNIDYILNGDYTLKISKLGYYDQEQSVYVEELITTTKDIDFVGLPEYSVKGKVLTLENNPVNGAKVAIDGYNRYVTTTAEDGSFIFDKVFISENYNLNISKNKLVTHQSDFVITNSNVDFGTVTLNNKIKASENITASEIDSQSVLVKWTESPNDTTEFRYDNGSPYYALGMNSGTTNSVLGTIYRTPAKVTSVSWMTLNTGSTYHYSVSLYILDLDELGRATGNVLFSKDYVSNSDNQWTNFVLPEAIDAPNGFMVGIAYWGNVGLGMDNGVSEEYPFERKVNCFTPDYTTGVFYYLEAQNYLGNFMMRAQGIPYNSVTEQNIPATDFTYNNETKASVEKSNILSHNIVDTSNFSLNSPITTLKSRNTVTENRYIDFDIYRLKEGQETEEDAWTLLTTTKDFSYVDNTWKDAEMGVYKYAVKSIYTNNLSSPATISELIGKDMLATVNLNLNTNTPENESQGAIINLFNADGKHAYIDTIADNDGIVSIPNVWKGNYSLTVNLEGFNTLSVNNIDLSVDSIYNLYYTLEENKITPYNVNIFDTEKDNERLLVWNSPSVLFEDFEGHEDFALNSPGKIGWQYIDGDGMGTGAFTNYDWANKFSPMAYIVMNPLATIPAQTDYSFQAYSGSKFLADFAASPGPNSDYLISPRLYFKEDFKFKFYAKSYYAYGGDSSREKMMVGYSTTGIEQDDFIWLTDTIKVLGEYWNQFDYTVPKEAKYVTIHCVSENTYIFMLDNVFIGLEEVNENGVAVHSIKASQPDGAFEVFLDGVKIAKTNENTLLLPNLTKGKHTAGVRATYTSGYTNTINVDFNIETSGIGDNSPDVISIYPNPTSDYLFIKGKYTDVKLYTINGSLVNNQVDIEGKINVKNLATGIYLLKVYDNNKVSTHKVVIK